MSQLCSKKFITTSNHVLCSNFMDISCQEVNEMICFGEVKEHPSIIKLNKQQDYLPREHM